MCLHLRALEAGCCAGCIIYRVVWDCFVEILSGDTVSGLLLANCLGYRVKG